MYNLFTISMIICWAIAAYFFYKVFYNKIKLHNVRMKMQEKGEIAADTNVTFFTFLSLFFWPTPATKYKDAQVDEHNRRLKQVNGSLLGLLLTFITFGIISVLLG